MIEVSELVKHYGPVRAVDGVTFTVDSGETLGLVGESGCGKSTTARLLVRLETATGGTVRIDGIDVRRARGAELRRLRRTVQLVFQDPYASLNPRLTVEQTLGEVLHVHRLAGGAARVTELLDLVGLPASTARRHPHELSGGQRQRVGIARALAVEPRVLVLDEPVSALDVSVRAEVMNLLARLREDLGLTYVFISHDLGMVRHLSDRIAVMYLGRIVELGDWRAVSDDPRHPYTQSLQDAVPLPDPVAEAARTLTPLRGEVPDPASPPPGCPFHPRCPHAEPVCRTDTPLLSEPAPAHWAACHLLPVRQPADKGGSPRP
ncbi:ABC transporter ATP-binding protein [Streptomyces sp. NPDC051940]|uniref:ABC transporter ATP-binding protein n=1 Tax=Streptomyces sp. NPDC051940 TaxID=3155675 RepID=UPI0034438A54